MRWQIIYILKGSRISENEKSGEAEPATLRQIRRLSANAKTNSVLQNFEILSKFLDDDEDEKLISWMFLDFRFTRRAI